MNRHPIDLQDRERAALEELHALARDRAQNGACADSGVLLYVHHALEELTRGDMRGAARILVEGASALEGVRNGEARAETARSVAAIVRRRGRCKARVAL